MNMAIMIKREYLIAAGATDELAGEWTAVLDAMMSKYDISATKKRVAAFLAQVAHESASFRATTENLNYSADALQRMFPRHFKMREDAERYAHHPELIANCVYADRMGNGSEASGEGWKFRGRGLIQLTGHENVRQFSLAFFNDDRLVEDPTPLSEPELASASACWFWNKRGLNQLADLEDMRTITMRINGGLNGFDDRVERWNKVRVALGDVIGPG
jgi:putative chitinase